MIDATQESAIMNKSKLKIGDIVQLRSGGPHMTITGVTKQTAECCWFSRDDKEQQSRFAQTALQFERVDDLTDEQLRRRIQALVETAAKSFPKACTVEKPESGNDGKPG
jgi:uncharacterized protein YodC (DUF2158 family)